MSHNRNNNNSKVISDLDAIAKSKSLPKHIVEEAKVKKKNFKAFNK